MQLLKPQVRRQIINAAKKEFLKQGFEQASMRRIAQSAWMTVGNLYRYFDCKETLYETITLPAYEYMAGLLNYHHDDQDARRNIAEEELLSLLDPVADTLTARRELFLILIDGSRGSKYETIKQEWIGMMADHIARHHLQHLIGQGRKEEYPFLPRALAVSFIEGLLEIIRCHRKKKDRKQSIKRHIKQFVYCNINMPVMRNKG